MARRWIEQVLRVLFDRLLLLRFGYIAVLGSLTNMRVFGLCSVHPQRQGIPFDKEGILEAKVLQQVGN